MFKPLQRKSQILLQKCKIFLFGTVTTYMLLHSWIKMNQVPNAPWKQGDLVRRSVQVFHLPPSSTQTPNPAPPDAARTPIGPSERSSEAKSLWWRQWGRWSERTGEQQKCRSKTRLCLRMDKFIKETSSDSSLTLSVFGATWDLGWFSFGASRLVQGQLLVLNGQN